MPVYEYECTQCNAKFEIMQKMNDDPLRKCNACGGSLKKLITNTSFVLKGSGWYVTDYPSADRKKALDAKKTSPATQDTKTDNTKDKEKKAVNT